MKNPLVVLFLFLFFDPFDSAALDLPRGPAVLTLSGSIQRTNKDDKAILDAAILRSLPQHKVQTDTPWTEGAVVFEGPLLRDVLDLVGAEGEIIKTTAINDYFVDIPVNDAYRFDIIMAMRMNGKELTIRTKGPLWVIYPWSSNDRLRSETYYSRSIWQLMRIDVR